MSKEYDALNLCTICSWNKNALSTHENDFVSLNMLFIGLVADRNREMHYIYKSSRYKDSYLPSRVQNSLLFE